MAETPPQNPRALPDVGVIITAMDETWSLRETVDALLRENPDTIHEIMIGIAPHTTQACRAVIAELESAHPAIVRHHQQAKLPGAGGANRECIPLMRSPWILLMAADLETHPGTAAEMIERAGAGDVDIVATSRWLGGSRFGDYSRLKWICNWLFQWMFSRLYGVRLTDMTFGFRLYRARELCRYAWRETGHAFFFEALITPLRCGARVAEVRTHWRGRREGTTHMPATEYLRYFRVGLSTRARPARSLMVAGYRLGRQGGEVGEAAPEGSRRCPRRH